MDQRATLEMIAPTVDEAVEKALEQLGLDRDRVNIDVLDEGGSGGLFGIGGRQARVRVTILGAGESSLPVSRPAAPVDVDADTENTMAIAMATLRELLENMGVRAEVSARLGESDERDEEPPIIVDLTGGDLSILIGRNAETLDALQTITRLIVGKELGEGVHLIVDVSGYRQRREDNLRQLAHRMADQAVNTGRQQTLEPMNPAERRIIHIELRDNPQVTTESMGQEPHRKITINPS
jgi:spoIIIJ-associated protein